jgi:hypothetical protein
MGDYWGIARNHSQLLCRLLHLAVRATIEPWKHNDFTHILTFISLGCQELAFLYQVRTLWITYGDETPFALVVDSPRTVGPTRVHTFTRFQRGSGGLLWQKRTVRERDSARACLD